MADLVLFDLDGTLVDHRGAVLVAIGQIVQNAENATLTAEQLVERWWLLERRHMRDYLSGACSFAEQRRRRLREFLPVLGEPVPDDAGLDAWFADRYLAAFEAAWRCYPDVLPCLDALCGLPSGPRRAVLTNGDPGQQRAKLARFGLLDYFEAVLTPTELGAAKPDPAAFTAACRQLRVDAERTLNVGDWFEGDVAAAVQAGVPGIWLDRGVDPTTGQPTEAVPDPTLMRIERLTDLIEHVAAP
jgi:HAD superfamily hydrolase (TIGR01549 family)